MACYQKVANVWVFFVCICHVIHDNIVVWDKKNYRYIYVRYSSIYLFSVMRSLVNENNATGYTNKLFH